MSAPLFLFGTLRDPEIFAAVAGEALAGRPARLPGFALRHAGQADWPLLAEAVDAVAEGVLVDPPVVARARIDWFEAAFGYRPRPVRLDVDGEVTEALAYWPEAPEAPGAAWSLEAWQAAHGLAGREAAREAMEYYGTLLPEALGARWPVICQRAISTRNAILSTTPRELRRDLSAADVEVVRHRRPYSAFFTVVEQDLRFRRFDGRWSEMVTRAGFIAGDAVTVLPYDPVRDAVLVIEQFRFGPYARGDRRPWVLEPIAGRIDPEEGPEATARRETEEEAGVRVGRLELVARYYPSTGALAEYVWSYVGLCDLSAAHGTVGGMEGEAEDILAHVIPFERLMAIVASGEAECAPLLLAAYWLAANRERIRAMPPEKLQQ